jgi:hypothetical protein
MPIYMKIANVIFSNKKSSYGLVHNCFFKVGPPEHEPAPIAIGVDSCELIKASLV